MVLEELPMRELLVMLLGPEGRRRMENRFKTNDQLFEEYYALITSSHAVKTQSEIKRVLEKYRSHIGQFPPTIENAVLFINLFKDRSLNTRSRYVGYISAFFKWFNGENLPIKIRVPKILPQYVNDADIDKLVSAMQSRKTHKAIIERDILLVELDRMTGLRRSELANLKVGDLNLRGNRSSPDSQGWQGR